MVLSSSKCIQEICKKNIKNKNSSNFKIFKIMKSHGQIQI
jgi:hypothetical protein